MGDIDKLVICTSTYYPIEKVGINVFGEDKQRIKLENKVSTLRMELALDTFRNIAELGAFCVLTDGGSSEVFLEEIKKINKESDREVIRVIPESLIEERMSMGESRRLAFFSAFGGTIDEWNNGDRDVLEKAGASFCLWVEPEKADLITKKNLEAILLSFKEQRAEIVILARLQEGWDTLPEKQVWIEQRANREAARLVKLEQFDLWFGPKVFSRKAARFFLESSGPRWEGLMDPVHTAIKEGIPITSIFVDYKYDLRQKGMEEGSLERDFFIKRVIQYAEIQAFLGNPIWQKEGLRIQEGRLKKERGF